MTARTNASIRLSADERRRLLAWGPDIATAVRRVLDVAEEARAWSRQPRSHEHGDALMRAIRPPEPPQPTTRELVRAGLAAGRSVADIARELGVTRQAVQWHRRHLR
jgi:DNA-binding NarL/FixJ family response regulator